MGNLSRVTVRIHGRRTRIVRHDSKYDVRRELTWPCLLPKICIHWGCDISQSSVHCPTTSHRNYISPLQPLANPYKFCTAVRQWKLLKQIEIRCEKSKMTQVSFSIHYWTVLITKSSEGKKRSADFWSRSNSFTNTYGASHFNFDGAQLDRYICESNREGSFRGAMNNFQYHRQRYKFQFYHRPIFPSFNWMSDEQRKLVWDELLPCFPFCPPKTREFAICTFFVSCFRLESIKWVFRAIVATWR